MATQASILRVTPVLLVVIKDCDITLEVPGVSREHCKLTKNPDGTWQVEDLGGKHGTRLDNKTITKPFPLAERSVIKVGKARLTFHLADLHANRVKPVEQDAAPVERASNPLQGITCPHCHSWLSTAHRLPGDQQKCAHCKQTFTLPSAA